MWRCVRTLMRSCHSSIKSQSINFFIIWVEHQQQNRKVYHTWKYLSGSKWQLVCSSSSAGNRRIELENLWMASETEYFVCPEAQASISSRGSWVCKKRWSRLSESNIGHCITLKNTTWKSLLVKVTFLQSGKIITHTLSMQEMKSTPLINTVTIHNA